MAINGFAVRANGIVVNLDNGIAMRIVFFYGGV